MKEPNQKVTFEKALKKSSLFTVVVLVLRIINKIVFELNEVRSVFHDVAVSEHRYLMILGFVLFYLLLWMLLSFIFAVIYYAYSKIKSKKTEE